MNLIDRAITVRDNLVKLQSYFGLRDILVIRERSSLADLYVYAVIRENDPTSEQFRQIPNIEITSRIFSAKGISARYARKQLTRSGLIYIVQGNFLANEYIQGTGISCSFVSINKGPPYLYWDLLLKEETSSNYRVKPYSM